MGNFPWLFFYVVYIKISNISNEQSNKHKVYENKLYYNKTCIGLYKFKYMEGIKCPNLK
jgi:hypothetical protein